MSILCIKNARVVLTDKIEYTNIIAKDGIICELSSLVPGNAKVFDAKRKLVTPGFVEIHTHGAGGMDFCDCTVKAFETVIKTHLTHGATLICPTLMSASLESILKCLDLYREVKSGEYGRFMHKIHLEGPYLNPEMCGAQRADIIRCPYKKELEILFEKGEGIIGRIGCAPEIDGISYLVEMADKYNVLLSIAHSDATASEAKAALDRGIRHITHLYSATSTVKKRNQRIYSGILEAAYLYDDFYVELIGDGRHVSKEQIKLALKIKTADKINLTTDSMRAAGQTDIESSYLGEICEANRVIIDDGVAKLPDKSFYAGSIATCDAMFKNAVLNYEVDVIDAVKMLATTPAKLVGADNKGCISPGKDCDIVIWNDDYTVSDVFVGDDKII